LPELESLALAHPFDERLRCRLALALYRSGRQAAALEACRDARRGLVDELGLAPTEELRDLEQQILRQDPALAGPAPLRPDVAAARRTVTVLSAQLSGGDGAPEETDPERLHGLVDRFANVVREAAERHGGDVQEAGGSGAATVVFGLESAHEDDAL